MSDLVQLIQEADISMLNLENARGAVEAAKAQFESAKEDFELAKTSFDETIAKADEINVPRAKLKKLVEERSAALMASGLYNSGLSSGVSAGVKSAKVSKQAKSKKASALNVVSDSENVIETEVDGFSLPEIDRTQAMM